MQEDNSWSPQLIFTALNTDLRAAGCNSRDEKLPTRKVWCGFDARDGYYYTWAPLQWEGLSESAGWHSLYAVSRKQLAEVGLAPSSFDFLLQNKSFGSRIWKRAIKSLVCERLSLSPCGWQNTACIKLLSSNLKGIGCCSHFFLNANTI